MSAESEQPPLTEPFTIGDVEIANRVLLAPLAGIGNWFVRLQARRYGAGLAVSEMVSSYAIRHGNERTLGEMLRIHPDEHPVSIQLFGPEPEVMRGAAATAAEAGVGSGDLLRVSTADGAIVLPVEITDMPDRVVWLPLFSPGSHVHAALRAQEGDLVALAPAPAPVDITDDTAGGAP